MGGVAFLVLAGVVGCDARGGEPLAAPRPDERERVEQQAQDALARWASAVSVAGSQRPFVPVEELTGQIGDWEPALGDNHKAALGAGLLRAAAPLPGQSPPPGQVQWADGATRAVPLVSADQALRKLTAAAVNGCSYCTPLQVTAAVLTAGQVRTSRGLATVPMWEFTLRGTGVRVTRVAIAASDIVAVVPPPWDSMNPPAGLSVESADSVAGGRRLTARFVGAPYPADRVCGIDYTAEAVESGTAVVVILVEHPHEGGLGLNQACPAIGGPRTATVELAEPLGARTVLEVRQGLPVPVTVTPAG